MIPLAVPNIGELERRFVDAALLDGHVGPDGPFVRQFEALVAAAAGRKWAIATITGTAALHAAVMTLWRGSIVNCPIVGNLSFPAMSNVLTLVGRAIRCNMSGIDHDLAYYCGGYAGPSIADRAPAIGEPASHAAIECYSFAANKIITCGHGGAIVGDDALLEERLRMQIIQGYARPGLLNYRIANLNAALGCAQMQRLAELKAAKRRIWDTYLVAGLPLVNRGASRWMCTLPSDPGLVDHLAMFGIQARAEPAGVSIPCSTGLTPRTKKR